MGLAGNVDFREKVKSIKRMQKPLSTVMHEVFLSVVPHVYLLLHNTSRILNLHAEARLLDLG